MDNPIIIKNQKIFIYITFGRLSPKSDRFALEWLNFSIWENNSIQNAKIQGFVFLLCGFKHASFIRVAGCNISGRTMHND